MKNKKTLLSIIIVLVLLITIFFILNNKIVKKSFVLKISGDFTSSGAQRNYNANLTFKNNILVSGEESYYVGQGGGCTNNCERINSCNILNGEWVDASGKSNCRMDYPLVPSITKKGIEEQIKSKKLIPLYRCGHLDLCYKILNISHINDGRPGGPGGSMGHR